MTSDVKTVDSKGRLATCNIFVHLNKYLKKILSTMPYRSWQRGIPCTEQQEILRTILDDQCSANLYPFHRLKEEAREHNFNIEVDF